MREISLLAAFPVGKAALVFGVSRGTRFSDLTVLVVSVTFPIAGMKPESGLVSAPARHRAGAMDGPFPARLSSNIPNWWMTSPVGRESQTWIAQIGVSQGRVRIGGYRPAVLTAAEVHGVPDQMDAAGLAMISGKAAVIASVKWVQPIDTGGEDVLNATFSQFIHHRFITDSLNPPPEPRALPPLGR